jgi:FkbM family methyltransferase
VLQILGGKRHGFFIDSGAADGMRGSNTLLLEREFGWTGICVEPNQQFFETLRANRRCHCINCCLYDCNAHVEFVDAGFLSGIWQEYNARMRNYISKTQKGKIHIVARPSRTIRSILSEYEAPSVIDYWSLDTEGSELAILRSFPFEEYSFRVLTVEYNYAPAREVIRGFLEEKGYRRYAILGIDDCYVRNERSSSWAWRSRARHKGVV